MKKLELKTIKTWSWYKAMPELMQEFFNELYIPGIRDIRSCRRMAENKYYDVVSEVGTC